jgi:uncharacterized protein YbjT (DUF2867 family)
MHLILTGATGLVGTAALHHLLAAPSVTKVTILSRRPVPLAANNPKVTTIIHEDYTSYPPALLADLKGAQACIWALGVSINDVPKEYVRPHHPNYTVNSGKLT